MSMLDAFFEWADNAGIEITDRTIIKDAQLHYKVRPEGKVVFLSLEMKPDTVPFPPNLREYDGKIMMD